MRIDRVEINASNFKDCPDLRQPLNDALYQLQLQASQAGDGVVRLRLFPRAVDVHISGVTPGAAPWPLKLAQLAGSPLGAVILRVQNLTDPGPSGIPTDAVAITSQRVDGGAVIVEFISGLTVDNTYRFQFGIYDKRGSEPVTGEANGR